MSNRIVVLAGSPRKGGNTDLLVEAFSEGATGAGKTLVPFRVAGMHIGGCLGCGHCHEVAPATCVQKDDMPPILEALRSSDALVLASPVYYFGVTSQLKAAIDRMFALLQEPSSIRRAALLMTCGADGAEVADASIAMFRRILAYQGWEEAGIVVAPKLHVPGQIAGRKELVDARAIGDAI